MRIVSYIAFAAGLALGAVWLLQELGVGAWIEHADSGASAALLLGLTLYLLDRQRHERPDAADPDINA